MKRPSVEKLVLARIEERGRGSVLTPRDFRDVGSRGAVAVALHRLVKKGVLRNEMTGVYSYPIYSEVLKRFVSPGGDEFAKAIAARNGLKLRPTAAYAANVTGLSTQVPMRPVYLTDGRARRLRLRNREGRALNSEIVFRRASARYMNARTEIGYLVIQGLRNIGRKQVGKKEYTALSRKLPPAAKKELLQDLDTAPAWIADIMRRLAAEAA